MKVVLDSRAQSLLRQRYLLPGETPEGLFERVAHAVSLNSKPYEAEYLEALEALEFLPNSPTLMNAGTEQEQLIACFVLPLKSNLYAFYQTLKLTSDIHKSGGGTGFSFSSFKNTQDLLGGLQTLGLITELTRHQGKRRGANMGVLPVSHPSIEEFIQFKRLSRNLDSFNLSVGITDKFMEEVSKGGKAAWLFDRICQCAWEVGDPGLIFLNEIQRNQPLAELGEIEATNPCGEVPLFPFEACVLGSVNLSRVLNKKREKVQIDFSKLGRIVRLGVRFLDDVIDQSKYPCQEIKEQVKATRKIGLGVMGFYEMLIKMGIPYDSEESVKTAEKLMQFISEVGWEMSAELAREKGIFPFWEKSRFRKSGLRVRNATVTAIAPTGSLSMIAGTTPSIEAFISTQSLKQKWIVKEAIKTSASSQLKIQEAFQKFTDNAVSKTINLPPTSTVDEVKEIYWEAWRKRLKGVTVYRAGSRAPGDLSVQFSDQKTDQ